MKNKLISSVLLATILAPMVEFTRAVVLPNFDPGSVAQAEQLNLGPIQPRNPGWGQPALYNVYLAEDNGRPIKNTDVRCHFSGKHQLVAYIGSFGTNAQGRASFMATIPGSWGGTWVNLNCAAPSRGVLKYWRVKG